MEIDYLPSLTKPREPEKHDNGLAVKMIVKFSETGKPTPLYVLWNDGRKFKVSSVLDMKPRVHDGIYYTVRIGSKHKKIHFVDNKWFIL